MDFFLLYAKACHAAAERTGLEKGLMHLTQALYGLKAMFFVFVFLLYKTGKQFMLLIQGTHKDMWFLRLL